MCTRWIVVLVAFTLCLCMSSSVTAAQIDNDYRMALMAYYNVPDEVVNRLVASRLTVEDFPVALLIHQRTGLSCETIAELRARGDSWMEIARARGMRPQDFYVIVVGNVTSRTYAPILAKFKGTPINQWHKIELTDADVVNLANLRFIASQHDYSIFKAMALRDRGKDFVRINHEVKTLKAELIRSQKKDQTAPG